MSKRPGSLLDLLPRPRTPAFDVLPEFIQAEIKLLRKGFRPLSPSDMDDLGALPKKLENQAIELRILAGKISDVHKAQSELGGKLLALLAEIQKEQAEHRAQLGDHDKRLDAHDIQLGVHAKKHTEHAAEITGVQQRLVVVEQLVTTKRKPRKRK